VVDLPSCPANPWWHRYELLAKPLNFTLPSSCFTIPQDSVVGFLNMLSHKAQKLLRGELRLYSEEGRQSTKLKVRQKVPCDLEQLHGHMKGSITIY
jgi:hypothetical protein